MKKNIAFLLVVLMVGASAGSGCGRLARMMNRNGTQFTVQVDSAETDKAAILQRAIAVTKRKIDLSRLDGEVVPDPDDGSRMIVTVYGAENIERLRSFLFTAHRLELRKVVSPPSPQPVQVFADEQAANKQVKPDEEVFQYSETRTAPRFLILEKSDIVTGENIRDASATKAGPGEYQITFSLDPGGSNAFGDWTGKNIGNYIAIVLDKKVESTAFIKTQIFDSGVINGRFSKESAEDIALSLKSGYLPASLQIVDEKPVKN